jgi:hypothetical protein
MQVLCFNGKAISRNLHKTNSGKSVLGRDFAVFAAFAEDVIRTLKSRCPYLVSEGLLRVDGFRCVRTGRFYVNEIEGE